MRTKGATSNVLVTLKQLNQLFQPDAQIPIARKFANSHGLIGRAIYTTNESMEAAGNPLAVEEKIPLTEFTGE
jgi:hypothetical protein